MGNVLKHLVHRSLAAMRYRIARIESSKEESVIVARVELGKGVSKVLIPLPLVAEQTGLTREFSYWIAGIQSELAFWNNWFATKGDRWPDDFQRKSDPQTEIDPALIRGFDDNVRILDVGAGPMTIVGSRHQGRRLHLTACDPLAPFYAEMAARHKVLPPVPTQFGFAEDLSAFFSPDTYHVIHCRNALDHSFDPPRGIEEMLIVAKSGGRIILSHHANEAENNQYVGLHQWNFDSDRGDFIIWNKSQRINASQIFAPYADVSVDVRDGWITVEMVKRASPPIAFTRYRDRVRDILPALTMACVCAYTQRQSSTLCAVPASDLSQNAKMGTTTPTQFGA